MKRSGILGLWMLWAVPAGAWPAVPGGDGSLLRNGAFAPAPDGRPAEWTVRDSGQKVTLDAQEKPPGADRSLRLDVVRDAGENYGEILQLVHVKPAMLYLLQGELRVTQARLGVLQIKRCKDGREIDRVSTPEAAPGRWQPLSLEFSSGEADSVQVLCRWRQNRTCVGQTAWFANLRLTEKGPAPAAAQKPVPTAPPRCEAVPTFESVGLYWSLPEGSPEKTARVEYRAAGSRDWKTAQDLWFDPRALGGRPAEYRGSIVGLKPGTRHEVRLSLAGTPVTRTLEVTTWSEAFPIARTVELPARSGGTLEIGDVHGSPDGYILYTGPGGGPAAIDVADRSRCNVRVTRSSYVILRGLNLTGGQCHGIELGDKADDDVHDIVIENCDISQWGGNDATGFGVDHHSGVYSRSERLERVTIQRNRIHHPRSNSNSWKEKHGDTFHPLGPQAISFMCGRGRYVIRYNELAGDPEHHFNDSMGADHNFSYDGFPNRDSDIYGNYVAYCWDDGLELEGADMNVRVWGNYITETYHPLANASVSLGPLYLFRNVAHVSRTGPRHAYGQCFLKTGGTRARQGYFGDGRVYLLNNTILILPGTGPDVKGGIGDGDRTLRNMISRNNILHVPVPAGGGSSSDLPVSISDAHQSGSNSFDYDLYNGRLIAAAGVEPHGIVGVPVYAAGVGFDPATMTGRFWLAQKSPGRDAGIAWPNFTDGASGAAPDIGAHESDTPPMQFGVRAYLPSRPAGRETP